MTETVYTNSQEEYEDDFEKDLDWLISEESRSEDQGSNYDDIEAEIDKELEVDEKQLEGKRKGKTGKNAAEEEEEKWPPPMEPLEYDSDRDSPGKLLPTVPPPPETEGQTDEEKKYILEKIQRANRELQEQETPDITRRRRRLHFKEKLVDLVVPPSPLEKGGNNGEGKGNKDKTRVPSINAEVLEKMSELKLSPRFESINEGLKEELGPREGKVLIEKDGKFDLVSMKDVESQGLLPPIASSFRSDSSSAFQLQQSGSLRKSPSSSSSSLRLSAGSSSFHLGQLQTPRPPTQSRIRPSSASHRQAGGQRKASKRRVQSATGTPCQATFTLSPQQKELLQRVQERKDKLAKEAEQRKQEEEELKRQENEQAFKAWVMRKREQLQEEKRIHRAQEIERINCKRESADPDEAFRLWLQRKHDQQQKERQLVKMKRLEEDSSYLLHSREECERAFKLWLRRKRAEKLAEQQAAREHSRRLVLEERRLRRTRDLMCTINETKPFRFTEQLAYQF
ncbi:coiled-coil domain-containing protein 181 isoform X2 [Oryzias melastigma]|nr:coiled-coil domain-containing protein 181 isoform X2 [Oryzias melastigma]